MENILKRLSEIEALIKRNYALNKEVLTLEESAEFLGLSKSALYKMTSKREIPFYQPGGKKVYFRRVELESWVLSAKVPSITDFERNLDEYLSNPKKS